MLDLYDKRYTSYNIRGAHKDNMAVRKQLVDVMFKRFDADANGRVEAGEISQVRLMGRKSKKEATNHHLISLTQIYEARPNKSMDIIVKEYNSIRKSFDLTPIPKENLILVLLKQFICT